MNYKRLAISLFLPQMAGIIGSVFTASAIVDWYSSLTKPAIVPPSWLFGPVWVTLYVLMGISIYLIWSSYAQAPAGQAEKIKQAMIIFWIHLFFNALWSIIFFGMRNPGLAFVDIIIIWLFIIVLIIRFWKIDKRASYLLAPYLIWVSIASVLNYYLWILN